MTHGIINTSTGRMESKEDNLQDWQEHVLMHYGRGTLLKEWYISPSVMTQDEWKALCTVHNWALKHRAALNNTVFVGGRPDEGNTYGYIGWKGDNGILIARNTQANMQKLIIPFDETVQYYGQQDIAYKANVLFPYQDTYPQTFTSGKNIEILLPGYATMAFELKKGKAVSKVKQPGAVQFSTEKSEGQSYTTLTVPADVKGRCELLLIGHPDLPAVTINGQPATIKRSGKGAINKFAGYAKAGMSSEKARPWSMAAIDLLPFGGRTIQIAYNSKGSFESYLLAERQVKASKAKEGKDILWAITNNTRRQTIRLF